MITRKISNGEKKYFVLVKISRNATITTLWKSLGHSEPTPVSNHLNYCFLCVFNDFHLLSSCVKIPLLMTPSRKTKNYSGQGQSKAFSSFHWPTPLKTTVRDRPTERSAWLLPSFPLPAYRIGAGPAKKQFEWRNYIHKKRKRNQQTKHTPWSRSGCKMDFPINVHQFLSSVHWVRFYLLCLFKLSVSIPAGNFSDLNLLSA